MLIKKAKQNKSLNERKLQRVFRLCSRFIFSFIKSSQAQTLFLYRDNTEDDVFSEKVFVSGIIS